MKDLKLRFWKFFKRFWPYIVIILLVCTFFWKVFLQNKVPLPADMVVGVYYPWLDYKWEGFPAGVPVKNPVTSDVVSFSYPMRILAVNLLRQGLLPLWNPYILGGTPLLANFQSAPFSITNIVYFVFDNLTAWSAQVILQHILAAIFTFLLLRNWEVSKLAAVVGGIVFSFSGFNLIWSQWNAHTLTASFIPLLLFITDKWLLTGKWQYAVGISFVFFFQILSGYPQLVFYTLIALFILWFVRLQRKKYYLFRSVVLGFYLALGIGLSALQILPASELLSFSQREIEAHPFEWAFLPWSKTITFLAPDFFGNHATGNWWGPQDYTSNTGFVGVIALTLALNSFRILKHKREVLYGLGLVIVSLVLAYPTPIAILNWKSGVFGLQAASAHRSLVLFTLGVSILSAFGLDILVRKNKFSLKVLLIPTVILGGYGLYAAIMYFLSNNNPDVFSPIIRGIPKYKVALRNLIFPVGLFIATTSTLVFLRKTNLMGKKLSIFILITLIIFELFRFGWKFTPFSSRKIVYPLTPVLDFLIGEVKPFRTTGNNVIPINMRMPYEIESLEGYDAIYPRRISEFIAAINSGKTNSLPQGRYGTVFEDSSYILELTNTKYYITIKRDDKGYPGPDGQIPWQFRSERFSVVFEDRSVAVLENKSALPRALMVYDWEVFDGKTKILDALLREDFNYREKVLLEKDVPIGLSIEKKVDFSVLFKKYSEQESIINVKSSKNGLLFVSDTWFPGWKALVDGKETEIYLANYAFRAVVVPEGEHDVVFLYKPKSFYNGVRISFVSLGLLIATVVVIGKRKYGSYTWEK